MHAIFRRFTSSRTFFERPKEVESNRYALLVVPVTAFGLGVWQLYRLRWKLGLIEERTSRTSMPALEMTDLPDNLEGIHGLEYRRVKLKGVFDHGSEVYLYPRSPINSAPGGLISNTSGHGGHVITPFRISDTKTTILFDRGWIPKSIMDPALRASSQPPGEVTVYGVLRNSERKNKFTPEANANSRNYPWRDVAAIAERLHTAPVFVEATSESNIPGGPIGGQTIINMRNEHLNYSMTWFTLAIISGWLWYTKFIKRKSFR